MLFSSLENIIKRKDIKPLLRHVVTFSKGFTQKMLKLNISLPLSESVNNLGHISDINIYFI